MEKLNHDSLHSDGPVGEDPTKMTVIKVSSKQKASNSFYSTTRLVFLVCQCSGLMPINGWRQYKRKDLGLSWSSLYILFSAASIIAHSVTLLAFFYNCVGNDQTFQKYTIMASWMCGSVGSIMYVNFGRNFEKMIWQIEKLEALLPAATNVKSITKKIRFIVIYFVITMTANYILQEIILITNKSLQSCGLLGNNKNSTLEIFFQKSHDCVFKVLPYNYFVVLILKLMKLQATFIWSMSDALIISCSIYLENQFKHFNERIFHKKIKETGDIVNWNELKSTYTNLSDLVRVIDRYLNPITFATFFMNMILICQQLILIIGNQIGETVNTKKGCKIEQGDLTLIQYSNVMSTALIIMKTVFMLFASAQLHSTSRKPLEALGTMPRAIYTYETQRFMDQIYHSTVALSGFKLFYFTRETILTVCSVMVTYELMLFQM